MKKEILRTPQAPSSPLYSQGIKVGSTLYISGMAGIDPKTNRVAGPTIQEQTTQALRNCKAILDTAGATLHDVVEVQILLARPEDFGGMNEAYAQFFPTEPPARSVARFGPVLPEVLVSVKATAIIAS